MAVRSSILIFALFISVMILAVWALIGVYVYRDAGRRGMSAVAWTLVALFAPALIGFIIYLLVRGSYPDLECPQCGAPVTEQYVVCPQCGTQLRPACSNCSGPVEPDWRVCPRCAAPLDGVEMHPAPPLRRRDKALSKILIAVIAVPAALIVLMFGGLFVFNSSLTLSSGVMQLALEDYDQLQESEAVQRAVRLWLTGQDVRDDRAYALRYDYSDDLDSGSKYYYLIYAPAAKKETSVGIHNSSGLFGPMLELTLEKDIDHSGTLICVMASGEKPPALSITLGGRRVPCDVEVVDYNPTLFYIAPNYAQAEPGEDLSLPERLLVVKWAGGESIGTADDGNNVVRAAKNAGVAEVTDKDLMLKILAAIDSGERVPMEEIPSFDFRDGFEIIVEYQIHEEYIMHHDMARHLAFMEDGVCYLDDSRVHNTAYGSSFRVMDADFYELLEDLFE